MLRPIERSSVLFPDMFEPVMRRTVPARTDRDVVGDAAIVGDERVADRRRRHLARRADVRDRPLGIVAPRGAELRERVELAERVEPASDAAASHLAPPLERKEHVEIPQRQRLHGKVQDRRTAPQLAEAENAIQPPHAVRCWHVPPPTGAREGLTVAPNHDGAATACSKIARVPAERILPTAGAIERLLDPIGGGE